MNSIFLSLILFMLLSCSTTPQRRTDRLSIVQGLTGLKEVEFSVLAPKAIQLRFELRSQEGEVVSPIESITVQREFSDMAIHKLLFERDQTRDYNLFVFDGEKLVDQRLIGRGQLNQSTLRLAVISCMDDGYNSHFKIWDELKKKRPEYVLMIGDNVYADRESNGTPISSTPETIWRRYVETRMTIPFFFEQILIPVHALWDDHDFGINDGNSDFEYKDESRKTFDSFFAQSLSEEYWIRGHGVGGLLSLGHFNLYFLDGRSFRSPNSEGKHLGTEQHNWLMKTLKSEAQPSLLIKGDQFFGGYHSFESYQGNHPQDFISFVTQLRATGAPVTFLSGDRHLSEIMQFPRGLFGVPTFEITSSPIHAKTFGPGKTTNPWRVVHEDTYVNFTMIDNVAKDNHWFMDVEAIDDSGKLLYRRELAVYIKDLQNNLNEAEKRRHGRRRSRSKRSKGR